MKAWRTKRPLRMAAACALAAGAFSAVGALGLLGTSVAGAVTTEHALTPPQNHGTLVCYDTPKSSYDVGGLISPSCDDPASANPPLTLTSDTGACKTWSNDAGEIFIAFIAPGKCSWTIHYTAPATSTHTSGSFNQATTVYTPNAPGTPAASAGYRIASVVGKVRCFGDAACHGTLPTKNIIPNKPIVGMAATPTGGGYWLVASDGGIFTFGNARFFGSMGGKHLNKPIVGMAATPTGDGYYEVASDGGIFTFGSARFLGSMGGHPLNKPVNGMTVMPTGDGYYEVASDGGIFTFGSARFHGSMGGTHLNAPVVGMAATPTGAGYWLVAADGGIFTFGSARFLGSEGGTTLPAAVTGMATDPTGGYWIVTRHGLVYGEHAPTYTGTTVKRVVGIAAT